MKNGKSGLNLQVPTLRMVAVYQLILRFQTTEKVVKNCVDAAVARSLPLIRSNGKNKIEHRK